MNVIHLYTSCSKLFYKPCLQMHIWYVLPKITGTLQKCLKHSSLSDRHLKSPHAFSIV